MIEELLYFVTFNLPNTTLNNTTCGIDTKEGLDHAFIKASLQRRCTCYDRRNKRTHRPFRE